MQAVVVRPQHRAVEVADIPEPAVQTPAQVLLRMLEVGVCGTDREIADFQYGTPPNGDDYLVLGHESLAQVVEVGSEVHDLAPGDLVVAMVRRPCDDPACRPCRQERQDYCVSGGYAERGIAGLHGFMTEYVVDDRRWLHPVPAHLRDVAVLIEPLTIAEKAMEQVWAVQQRLPWGERERSGEGLRALVLGAGPVGLLGAMALQVAGFDTFVYSRSPAPNPKADVAEAIGAPYISSAEVTPDELRKTLGRIDLCYEAAGISHAAFDVLHVLGANGVFILTGVPGDEEPAHLDSDDLMRDIVLGNQAVVGTVNAGAVDFVAAIDDLVTFDQRWSQPLRRLITRRHPISSAAQLLTGRSDGIKDVIRFGDT